jgi:hypothetical protein
MASSAEVITVTQMIEAVKPLGLDLTGELPASGLPDFTDLYEALIGETGRLVDAGHWPHDGDNGGERIRTRRYETGQRQGRISLEICVDRDKRIKEVGAFASKIHGPRHDLTIERPYVYDDLKIDPQSLFINIALTRAGWLARRSSFITSNAGYKDLSTGEINKGPDGWIFVNGEAERDEFNGLVDDPATLEFQRKRLWIGVRVLGALNPSQFTQTDNPMRTAAIEF